MGLIKPKRCSEQHLFMNDDAMIMQDLMREFDRKRICVYFPARDTADGGLSPANNY